MDPAPYFSRRAQDERSTASEASSEQSQRAHLELSFRCEKLASDILLGQAQERAAGPADELAPDKGASLPAILACAIPLPSSGAFGDLLDALEGRGDAD